MNLFFFIFILKTYICILNTEFELFVPNGHCKKSKNNPEFCAKLINYSVLNKFLVMFNICDNCVIMHIDGGKLTFFYTDRTNSAC